MTIFIHEIILYVRIIEIISIRFEYIIDHINYINYFFMNIANTVKAFLYLSRIWIL